MKSLSTLIDLKQRDLDEKRRVLVQLEEQQDKLEQNAKQLKEELAHESALASGNPDIARFFGEFAKSNKQKQEVLAEKKVTLLKLIEVQRENIREAFTELKQLEIAKENRDDEEAANATRKENAELDEIGLRGFLGD